MGQGSCTFRLALSVLALGNHISRDSRVQGFAPTKTADLWVTGGEGREGHYVAMRNTPFHFPPT